MAKRLQKPKKKMVGMFMTQDDHDRLREASAMYGFPMSEIMVNGMEKEILFLELIRKYDLDTPLMTDLSKDRETLLRQNMEVKNKVAEEFSKRVIF